MKTTSFLVSGMCATCFFHAAAFFLVAPKADVPLRVRPRTESFFLGAILKEVDVRPLEKAVRPSRHIKRPMTAAGDFMGRPRIVVRLPEKPFVALSKKEERKLPGEAPRLVSSPTQERLTFGLSDVGQYFLNIDFTDIAKAVARDEFSGVVEFEVVVSGGGAIKSLRRTMGSGNPVLDNDMAIRFKRAVLKSPWAEEGALFRLRVILKTQRSARVPN